MAGELSARIGSNFSDYQGNPILGGSTAQVFNIDTKPLEQLGHYTFFWKKSLWDQKQKDTDATLKEISDISKIRLADLRGKDKTQVTTEFAGLIKDMRESLYKPTKTTEEKINQALDRQEQIGAFMNKYDSGKTRATSYAARYKDILDNVKLNPKQQAAAIKELDDLFDNTDVETPISALPKYTPEIIDIPNPVKLEVNTIDIGGNENAAIKSTLYNWGANTSLADAAIFKLNKNIVPKTIKDAQGKDVPNPAYTALSDVEKGAQNINEASASEVREAVDISEPFNHILGLKDGSGNFLYYDDNGNFNAKKFEEDNASNTVIMRPYNAIKRMNEANLKEQSQATQGLFTNKGFSFKLPTNYDIDKTKAAFIDLNKKKVSLSQLIQSGIYAKYEGDDVKPVITETDNAIQNRQIDETVRNNKADQYLKSKDQKLAEDKWKVSMTGGNTQINGAMTRAKRIYGDMLKLADKNGVITPEKIRQLNVEQLKYLGIEAADGNFTPLTLEDKVNYGIQLVDGQVKVFKDAELLEGDKEGRITGTLDPTKSTNLFNIGTNILNEELKNSGSKELNTYVGVDITGAATSTTEGGSSTVSGSSKTVQSNSNIPSYSRAEFKSAGWTDKQINDALKAGKINIK